jgi:hypothetical protein
MTLAWFAANASTHSIAEHDEHPVPDGCAELLALLYPTCEHGLSASLCNGPGHYSDGY